MKQGLGLGSYNYVTIGGGAPPAPVNTVPPAISGNDVTGSELSSTTGTWTNATSYEYQWNRDGVAIAGEDHPTYDVVAADEGKAITCTVTAYNGVVPGTGATSNTINIYNPAATTWMLYLDSRFGVTVGDPNKAAIWDSQLSGTVDAVQANPAIQPAIVLNDASFGNQTTLRFTGTNTMAMSPAALSSSFNLSVFTFFFALKMNTASGQIISDNSGWFVFEKTATHLRMMCFNSSSRAVLLPYTTNTKVYGCAQWQPAGGIMRIKQIGGSWITATSGATAIGGSANLVIRNTQVDNTWGAIMTTNGLMSDADVDNHLEYLQAAFGV